MGIDGDRYIYIILVGGLNLFLKNMQVNDKY